MSSPNRDDSPKLTKAGAKITVYLHEDEYQALRRKSFEEHRSQASIIREALRRLLVLED